MTAKKLGIMALCAVLAVTNIVPAMAQESTEMQMGTEGSRMFRGNGRPGNGGPGNGGPGNGSFGGGSMGAGGMGMETESDPEIQAVLDSTADKFEQFTYTDPDTGASMEYSLYIPADYSEEESYPLILFVPDATGVGKSASQVVSEYYGAAVWASDEEQEKHASFVLAPAFTKTITDDNWNTSEEIETVVKLINSLAEQYSIDTDRLYTTGQSAGCMTSLYLNSEYPDLFAASLFVSGQWDISVLQLLENAKFFYVTAGGDEKASGGQDEVMAMFDSDSVSYSYGTWDAQDDADTQNSAAEELASQGFGANFIRFTAGSVLNGGGGMEHMASFNYAYKIEAVRDWLFAQSK